MYVTALEVVAELIRAFTSDKAEAAELKSGEVKILCMYKLMGLA